MHNPYKLIDASKLKLEDLQKFDWAGVMQFFMQRIWHNTLLQDLTIMSQQLKNIGLRHDGLELIKAILCYNENGIAKEQEEDLSKALSHITNEKNIEELMGTLAQSYRQEGLEQGLMQGLERGREEGLEQEKYNVARNLLKLGMDDQIITKATGLNLVQIAQLKKEI